MALYSTLTTGRGRKSSYHLDLLRSTTVLAHSTLEDYLRSVLMWRLPSMADSAKLNQVPLVGMSLTGNRETKFKLGDLVAYKGKTVDEVIEASIVEHLGMMSFNNTTDIVSAMRSIGVEVTEPMRDCFPLLDEMIKRRHNIVHRADRDGNRRIGSGNHAYKSISLVKVKSWINQIDSFVNEVNSHLRQTSTQTR